MTEEVKPKEKPLTKTMQRRKAVLVNDLETLQTRRANAIADIDAKIADTLAQMAEINTYLGLPVDDGAKCTHVGTAGTVGDVPACLRENTAPVNTDNYAQG